MARSEHPDDFYSERVWPAVTERDIVNHRKLSLNGRAKLTMDYVSLCENNGESILAQFQQVTQATARVFLSSLA